MATTAWERRVSARHPDANVWSEYEIEAQTSLVDRPLRNLKHADAFAVLDALGDMGAVEDSAEGVFYRDTRYLSRLELRIEGKRPLLLGSVQHDDKAALSVALTNPDIALGEHEKLPRDTIFLHRTKFLWHAVCYEHIAIRNYGAVTRRFRIDFLFGADFRDLFEVRGARRKRRGEEEPELASSAEAAFRYCGLDGIQRRTVLRFQPAPQHLEPRRATMEIVLAPGEQTTLFLTVSCEEDGPRPVGDFFLSYRDARRARRASTAGIASVSSSNDLFNEVASRSTSDVYTLVTHTPLGPYPYAGIPWFNTFFGRDGIITAMLMLWMDPSIARGVLRTLAATQATTVDPQADAQPGKILHEMRHGEMANLGEVPFGRYYGSVDSTPLFLVLAGMYLDRTGDRQTIAALWPNIEAALAWIDQYGDSDGDGFCEYYRETESGLVNQGWKDSYDAISHADGSLAEGPIALCEVQGYIYAAKHAASRLAADFGHRDLSVRLLEEAEQLRLRFEAAFWCEEIGSYALALDGAKRPCAVRASNAGHALFTGIAAPERAAAVARSLMGAASFSGWGIRTLAQGERRYNPMSYHNGSVWPHDNALTALGFARYGLKADAARIFEGLFSAARHQEVRRLPELFCGFIRHPQRGPTAYPVACSPQAWSATAPFGALVACLGLELSHGQNEVRFREPEMPAFLDDVVIRNLQLGESRLDIRLHRYGNDVTANVLARQGSARMVILK